MDKKMILCVESIAAGYGKKEVLRGVSFSLEAHTLTCLIGKNGCGKTTLLKCIMNQISHEGSSWLNGEELETFSTKTMARNISYIPQKSGIQISLPVMEVVLMGFNPVLRILERPSKKQRELAKKALHDLGMTEYQNQDYLTLSEGQKQLVLLARTMIEDTKLLLLDEPDSALDFQNRHMVLQQLRNIVEKEEKAGLLCLHDPILAMEMCDQLILLKDGGCTSVLRPQVDNIDKMEKALRKIYGNISLAEHLDKNGKRHFALMWEENK